MILMMMMISQFPTHGLTMIYLNTVSIIHMHDQIQQQEITTFFIQIKYGLIQMVILSIIYMKNGLVTIID